MPDTVDSPEGISSPYTFEQVQAAMPFRASLCELHVCRCNLCNRRITQGETFWRPQGPNPVITWCCYECGVGCQLHVDPDSILDKPPIPPFGGGLGAD